MEESERKTGGHKIENVDTQSTNVGAKPKRKRLRIFSQEWKAHYDWDNKKFWSRASLVLIGDNKRDIFWMCIVLFLVLNGSFTYKHDLNGALQNGYWCGQKSSELGYAHVNANEMTLAKCKDMMEIYISRQGLGNQVLPENFSLNITTLK